MMDASRPSSCRALILVFASFEVCRSFVYLFASLSLLANASGPVLRYSTPLKRATAASAFTKRGDMGTPGGCDSFRHRTPSRGPRIGWTFGRGFPFPDNRRRSPLGRLLVGHRLEPAGRPHEEPADRVL